MTRQALCVCGHWNDQHQECIECPEDKSHGEAWHVVCICGCAYFQTDYEEMIERKNEAKQLRYDILRGK